MMWKPNYYQSYRNFVIVIYFSGWKILIRFNQTNKSSSSQLQACSSSITPVWYWNISTEGCGGANPGDNMNCELCNYELLNCELCNYELFNCELFHCQLYNYELFYCEFWTVLLFMNINYSEIWVWCVLC